VKKCGLRTLESVGPSHTEGITSANLTASSLIKTRILSSRRE
jgi:hypothetical protein